MRAWIYPVLLMPALLGISLWASASPRIAIIIDDLGYHRARSEAVLELPGSITCAFIPQAPHARTLAAQAVRHGKEVILHLPMEAANGQPLDPGGLHSRMSRDEFQATVQQALNNIPQARGANNHMGGLLTTLEQPMQWLMEVLADRGLFFIDSRTSGQSRAMAMARQAGIRYQGRDVFLDNERDLQSINRQFNQGLALARKRGHAILIGHPYPETIEYLSAVLPLLTQADVQLVPVSHLLRTPPLATKGENHVTGIHTAHPGQQPMRAVPGH